MVITRHTCQRKCLAQFSFHLHLDTRYFNHGRYYHCIFIAHLMGLFRVKQNAKIIRLCQDILF
jgi:hypothetical protein